MRKHIGLIAASARRTAVHYWTLVRLHAAAGQPLVLTIAHADLATLIAHVEAGCAEAQTAIFARHFVVLLAGGCDVVA